MKGCKRNPLLTPAYDSCLLETTKTSLSHHGDGDKKTALNLQKLQNMIKNIRKKELLMGPFTLGLTQDMQACQWLLTVPDRILHQLLCPTGGLPLAGEVPAAAGGLETPIQLLPHGARLMASRYRCFFLFCFSIFTVPAFSG